MRKIIDATQIYYGNNYKYMYIMNTPIAKSVYRRCTNGMNIQEIYNRNTIIKIGMQKSLIKVNHSDFIVRFFK